MPSDAAHDHSQEPLDSTSQLSLFTWFSHASVKLLQISKVFKPHDILTFRVSKAQNDYSLTSSSTWSSSLTFRTDCLRQIPLLLADTESSMIVRMSMLLKLPFIGQR